MFKCVEYSVDSDRFLYKIEVNLPVDPKTNVFSKMTNIQMTNFKDKIDDLYKNLIEVRNEAELVGVSSMAVNLRSLTFYNI